MVESSRVVMAELSCDGGVDLSRVEMVEWSRVVMVESS